MQISVLNNTSSTERRVALTPKTVQKWQQSFADVTLCLEQGAGEAAGFSDAAYIEAGVKVVSRAEAMKADVLLTVDGVTGKLNKNQLLTGFLDPLGQPDRLTEWAEQGTLCLPVEKVPRISRAQSMDALSSQANLGGYRAVLEAANHYPRLLPLMMTAAGSAAPARVVVLGAGVAGLQAIATARRLGAQVEAFDIRAEVKEQIQSLGAKFLEFDLGEEGAGEGGYAKELSAEARAKQQQLLQEYLPKADVIITTAQIPGRTAPELVTEEAVKAMKDGSVIVDLAAASGGNCRLTEADKVVTKHGVILVGHTNFASMVPQTASEFYANNLFQLVSLVLKHEDGVTTLNTSTDDEIIQQALITAQSTQQKAA